MSTKISVEPPRRRWGWWLAGFVLFVVIFTAGRLVYPTFRQRQLITQLKERGFTFTKRQIVGDWREAWVNHRWLPHWLRNAYRQEIVVGNPRNACTSAEFTLLTELVSWDEEWFHSPSRSWFSLNLRDATDSDLKWLQPRVQYLIASGSEITDEGMSSFQRTPHLSVLSLDAKQIGDRELAHLAGLKRLVHLHLNGQHITDAGMVHLAGLTKLRTLRLAGTQVTDAGLQQLVVLTDLEQLDLTNSQVSLAGLEKMTQQFRLISLNLIGNPVLAAGLFQLEKFPNLGRFDLSRTYVTDSGLGALADDDRWLDQIGHRRNLCMMILNGPNVTSAGVRDLETALRKRLRGRTSLRIFAR
ncbi:MAG: hypothetical protein JWN70_658 [Planctomycetaceae bacterium]|nr:hypothetical protein [Planctomycetaceae bacterium]